MNNKNIIAIQELIIANAQAKIKRLKSQQGKRFKPEIGGEYFIVDTDGDILASDYEDLFFDRRVFHNFNMYETEELATKAAKYMKRNNAITTACLQVDPDFVPDYLSGNQEHHSFCYQAEEMGIDPEWIRIMNYSYIYGPCVSTQEKWEEAAALLKEWRIE
jgi:hypothetical protein